MNKEIVRNEQLGEQYTIVHHKSGLDIMMWKMEGFRTVEALFGTKYGALNNRFRTKKHKDFIDVPEGIAHYLEHKLFENEDSDVFELYAQTGADANAYTATDETVYLFSSADDYVRPLEILLDFVQNPYFTEENVAKEQGIIGQEIRMGEDSPSRQCFVNMLKALYVNNPVRIDVAGTVESISHITPDLLYECYNAFYNLHNMVLSIAGNIDEDKVLEVCDRMLKPCEDMELETQMPEEPEEVNEKRKVIDFPVGVPMFNIGFKSAAVSGLEYLKKYVMAGMILTQLAGSTSPLYKELFDEGLINSRFGCEPYAGAGTFFCCLFAGESKDPDEVYRRICSEIEKIKKNGFDKKRFEIERKSRYGKIIHGINNVESCADAMLESHFFGVSAFDEAEVLAKLTPEECLAQIDEILCADKSSISIVENLSKPEKV